MKYVFFGTPELSVMVLNELKTAGLLPSAVVTQADKPSGRGQKLTPSPVKVWAQQEHIPVLDPLKATDPEFLEHLRKIDADTFVVAAYGKMLRLVLLEIPKMQTINLHPSLLPLYRGPAPIQGPLLDGATKTGVSIMLIDEEMDHGDILAQKFVTIEPADDSISLTKKVAHIGGVLLAEVLPQYLSGKTSPKEQEHDKATFTHLLKKEDGRINWEEDAGTIVNKVRAYQLWPTAWTTIKSENEELRIKLLKVSLSPDKNGDATGTLLQKNDQLCAVAQNGSVIIEKLQIAGKNPMTGKEFADWSAKNQVVQFF